MRTLKSWDQFATCAAEIPQVHEDLCRRCLYISAYFEPIFEVSDRAPSEAYETALAIEDILAKSFPDARVMGIQTPKFANLHHEQGWELYRNCIHAVKPSLGIVYIEMFAKPTYDEHKAPFWFRALFPAEAYHAETQKALTGIWPKVRGIEKTMPNEFAVETQLDRYGLGSIVLLANCGKKNPQYLANGEPALAMSYIELPEKPINLVGGYEHDEEKEVKEPFFSESEP